MISDFMAAVMTNTGNTALTQSIMKTHDNMASTTTCFWYDYAM